MTSTIGTQFCAFLPISLICNDENKKTTDFARVFLLLQAFCSSKKLLQGAVNLTVFCFFLKLSRKSLSTE